MENFNTKSKLNIGYIMQNGAPDLEVVSGPQLHTTAVINGLRKTGHQVRIIAIQKNKLGWTDNLEKWCEPKFTFSKRKWFHLLESFLRRIQFELKLPFWGFFDSLHFADACKSQLKDFDVVYERHGYLGYGGILASRWLKIPHIIEINGNIIEEIEENGVKMSSLQRALGRWITYQTWRKASHIVVVSESLRKYLVEDLNIPDSKITVVLNGVNVDLFSKKFDETEVKEKFHIENGPIITFVGSFQPWHGVDILVSSFKKVLGEFPTLQLILVGDGALRNDVVQQINNYEIENNVKILGRLAQEEVAAILQISDVVAAPYPFIHSQILGTPLKLLEYMAAKKAIVASTAPIHDFVNNGVTGLRVPPADADALASGLIKLLRDDELRSQLGSNAYSFVKIKYSWDRVVEKLEAIMIAKINNREFRQN